VLISDIEVLQQQVENACEEFQVRLGIIDRVHTSLCWRTESLLRCMGTTQSICCRNHLNTPISQQPLISEHMLTGIFCSYKWGIVQWVWRLTTGWTAWVWESQSLSPSRGKIFLLSTSSRPVLGPTKPPIQRVSGALSPGVKRPGHKADHSLPTSAKGKNMWIYTVTPPYVFMA
jgi:hypothetical protein